MIVVTWQLIASLLLDNNHHHHQRPYICDGWQMVSVAAAAWIDRMGFCVCGCLIHSSFVIVLFVCLFVYCIKPSML